MSAGQIITMGAVGVLFFAVAMLAGAGIYRLGMLAERQALADRHDLHQILPPAEVHHIEPRHPEPGRHQDATTQFLPRIPAQSPPRYRRPR